MFPHSFRDQVQAFGRLERDLDRSVSICGPISSVPWYMGSPSNEFREKTPITLLPSGSVLISPRSWRRGATGIQRQARTPRLAASGLRDSRTLVAGRARPSPSRSRTGLIRSGEVGDTGLRFTGASVAMQQPARGSFRKRQNIGRNVCGFAWGNGHVHACMRRENEAGQAFRVGLEFRGNDLKRRRLRSSCKSKSIRLDEVTGGASGHRDALPAFGICRESRSDGCHGNQQEQTISKFQGASPCWCGS
jgi:hypothetical protein